MKKAARISLGILLAIIAAAAAAAAFLNFYAQKPHARFVLNMAGIREPVECVEREAALEVKGRQVLHTAFAQRFYRPVCPGQEHIGNH